MLRTLFGDLDPPGPPATGRASAASGGFAATEIFEGDDEAGTGFAATALFDDASARAAAREAPATEVFVAGSPAQAIREHFATARADLQSAGAMITLLDPSRLWAASVIKALADATGQAVERLHLRERATLRSLALIERTAVVRRATTPLKVYHADIRALGAEHDEIANALAERSHMVAVIVGALPPAGVEALLRSLLAATRQPTWQCPHLVFMLPPGGQPLGQRVMAQDWPATVQARVLSEPLTGVSSVWNAVLAAWDAVAKDDAALMAAQANALAVGRAISGLARTEGVLGCALIELAHGEVLHAESPALPPAMLRQQAQALLAARRTLVQAPGEASVPEELMVTAGPRIALLRAASATARQAVLVLLDRQHANLALVRFKLMEAERLLD